MSNPYPSFPPSLYLSLCSSPYLCLLSIILSCLFSPPLVLSLSPLTIIRAPPFICLLFSILSSLFRPPLALSLSAILCSLYSSPLCLHSSSSSLLLSDLSPSIFSLPFSLPGTLLAAPFSFTLGVRSLWRFSPRWDIHQQNKAGKQTVGQRREGSSGRGLKER